MYVCMDVCIYTNLPFPPPPTHDHGFLKKEKKPPPPLSRRTMQFPSFDSPFPHIPIRQTSLPPTHTLPNPPPPFLTRLFLKHLDRINQPVRLGEGAGILSHKRLARARFCFTAALLPILARPLPAKGRVEDEVHVLEVLVHVAVAAGVVRERGAPCGRAGHGVADEVGGDVLAGEEPDGDGGGVPLGRVDAAADVVEAGAEVGRVGREDAAARVDLLAGGVGVAVGGVDGAGHARLWDGAAAGGMEGHGVGLSTVDAFDDVDFAIRGPVGSNEPESGPDATDAAWHMRDICQK